MGNLKFDAAKLDERYTLDVPAIFRQLGVPPDAQILVAGTSVFGSPDATAAVRSMMNQDSEALAQRA